MLPSTRTRDGHRTAGAVSLMQQIQVWRSRCCSRSQEVCVPGCQALLSPPVGRSTQYLLVESRRASPCPCRQLGPLASLESSTLAGGLALHVAFLSTAYQFRHPPHPHRPHSRPLSTRSHRATSLVLALCHRTLCLLCRVLSVRLAVSSKCLSPKEQNGRSVLASVSTVEGALGLFS